MPKCVNRNIIVTIVFLFVITQTIIFAGIPQENNRAQINLVIKSGTGLWNIAEKLKNDGVIYSSILFVLCTLPYRGRLIAGEYTLRKDMSIIDVVQRLGRGERNIYALKIIEGHNLYNVAASIGKTAIMGGGDFLALASNKDFLQKIGIDADSLEGYLTPDTYYYSKEVEADVFIEAIVKKTFRNLEKESIKKRMQELKFDIHKTLTLASIIEREAKLKEEKPIISAVFHNRLQRGMSLDADPTVIYGTKAFNEPIKKTDLTTYTPYNTYAFAGLPKGPICNPDWNSITAALYPASVDYLYFVSKNDGTHVFSRDMDQHNRFVTLYQRSKNAKKQ
ncbi:MAG TPA: endolytic transglycosylase MltG [Syntrophorhabdus sp.]|jgi:UPF0755 protein|nr:endolytic transglycosylase MltG [Syntrophorhabdus sp.]MDI9558127.1 endolytic transglycosylase MltG [Pseudomonadota bacterium]HNQ46581.1 endolytic transglycosylase MltG [Syntrophorhabdus sp.]HOH27301.1 endolytic transglycosylase MltG [Syntrophorhabdus sp.]HQH83816.1 endolytic transglycosylase MltG [Syntrophorhabdus sp.]